jgi:tRNA(fMet)-specific endonuclease VapC
VHLFDTNHCSRLIQGDPHLLARLQADPTAVIATSVIVQGELIFMVERSEQVEANRARVESFLQGIRV